VVQRTVVQSHSHVAVNGKHYRVSDDRSVAWGADAKHFYALPAKAMTASAMLQESGSVIRLYEKAGDTLSLGAGGTGPDLVRVEIIEIDPKSTGEYDEGEFIDMPNDCRETCELVTGDANLFAETAPNPGGVGYLYPDPGYMKGRVVYDWLVRDELPRLRTERESLEGTGGLFGSVNRKKTALDRRVASITSSLAEATSRHDQMAAVIDELKPLAVRKKVGEKLDESQTARLLDLSHSLNDLAEKYTRGISVHYLELDPRSRAAVDESLGIGSFAAPGVGEAFVTPFGPGEAAPYHYGAVIMVSDDGNDRLTFENYINPGAPAQNTNWNLDMYGKGDTWDERWNADGVSTTLQVG
jgi:hypothetical protein